MLLTTVNTVFLSLLSLGLVNAIPQFNPPTHAPGCPYPKSKAGVNRVQIRFWYDPDSILANGGYRDIAADHFFPDVKITDTTPNYPKKQKGKKYPPPGTYAKSRNQFADIHARINPEIQKVLGPAIFVEGPPPPLDPPEGPPYNCLVTYSKSYRGATLKQAWGGKPAGTNVTWIDTRTVTLSNTTADDDGFGYNIKSIDVKMDWSGFYSA